MNILAKPVLRSLKSEAGLDLTTIQYLKENLMYFVYIIKSINFPEIIYVGSTSNIQSRINTHNQGGSIYTNNYKPWDLVWYSAYNTKQKALEFEKYLKSHSGKAFLNKRLI